MDDLTEMPSVGLDEDTVFFNKLGNRQLPLTVVGKVRKQVSFSDLSYHKQLHPQYPSS